MVGKRKRETTVVSRETSDAKESATAARQPQDAQEALRKYFEAHFEPIESLQVANGADSDSETIVSSDNDEGEEEEEEEEDEGEENSEWDGISDDESENTGPEVVDHSIRAPAIEITDKDAKKSFMVGLWLCPFFFQSIFCDGSFWGQASGEQYISSQKLTYEFG